jgi:hypothetical protein
MDTRGIIVTYTHLKRYGIKVELGPGRQVEYLIWGLMIFVEFWVQAELKKTLNVG